MYIARALSLSLSVSKRGISNRGRKEPSLARCAYAYAMRYRSFYVCTYVRMGKEKKRKKKGEREGKGQRKFDNEEDRWLIGQLSPSFGLCGTKR